MPYAVKCSLNSQGAFAISGYKRFEGHFRSPQSQNENTAYQYFRNAVFSFLISLFCLIFTSYRLNAKHEVYHMAHPQGSNDAGYPYSFSCHHEEAKSHKYSYRCQYANLCFDEHPFLFNK